MTGYYYLHTNGDLIYKKFAPDPSDFVRKIWAIDTENRATAWILCVEALAIGARRDRVSELIEKWGLTDEDGLVFIENFGGKIHVKRDGDAWRAHFNDFVNVQDSQVGFGPTVLEALAELAKGGLLQTEKRK